MCTSVANLTPEQQAYATKHHCKQLTFDGVNDLYQTMYGARTIASAIEMETLAQAYWHKQAAIIPRIDPWDKASPELMRRHLKSIEMYGVSPYC